MPLTDAVKNQIESHLQKSRIVLFMKGNKHFPQCGFSAQVVKILGEVGVPFDTVNVLADPAIRDGIKEYAQWPTIPQLWVEGKFIGGCDIVKDLYASGELQPIVGAKPEEVEPPALRLSEGAIKAFKAADDGSGDTLRLEINPEFQHDLYFGPPTPTDVEVTVGGLSVRMDKATARRANGLSIEWVEHEGGAFKIDNPNEPPRVRPLGVGELKQMMDSDEPFELVDVRTPEERKIARLERARPMDAETEAYLRSVDKDTKLVFHCHHGMRSRAAAEHFLQHGFRRVYNLEGGIEAWSQKIDPKVARY